MENHGLDNVLPVLRRWAQHSDQPLPANFKQYEDKNATAAMALRDSDPELVALLSNTAGAGLKADALSGALSPVAPDLEHQRKQEKSAQIQALYEAIKEAGIGKNLTAEMQLAAIAPDVLERTKKQLEQPIDNDYASAQMRRAAKEEADLITRSKNHANHFANPWLAQSINRRLSK